MHAHMCVYVCLTMVFPRGRNGNVCIAEEKYVKKFSNLNIFPLPFPHAMTVVTFHRLLAIVGTRHLQKVREGRYNNPNDPSRA